MSEYPQPLSQDPIGGTSNSIKQEASIFSSIPLAEQTIDNSNRTKNSKSNQSAKGDKYQNKSTLQNILSRYKRIKIYENQLEKQNKKKSNSKLRHAYKNTVASGVQEMASSIEINTMDNYQSSIDTLDNNVPHQESIDQLAKSYAQSFPVNHGFLENKTLTQAQQQNALKDLFVAQNLANQKKMDKFKKMQSITTRLSLGLSLPPGVELEDENPAAFDALVKIQNQTQRASKTSYKNTFHSKKGSKNAAVTSRQGVKSQQPNFRASGSSINTLQMLKQPQNLVGTPQLAPNENIILHGELPSGTKNVLSQDQIYRHNGPSRDQEIVDPMSSAIRLFNVNTTSRSPQSVNKKQKNQIRNIYNQRQKFYHNTLFHQKTLYRDQTTTKPVKQIQEHAESKNSFLNYAQPDQTVFSAQDDRKEMNSPDPAHSTNMDLNVCSKNSLVDNKYLRKEIIKNYGITSNVSSAVHFQSHHDQFIKYNDPRKQNAQEKGKLKPDYKNYYGLPQEPAELGKTEVHKKKQRHFQKLYQPKMQSEYYRMEQVMNSVDSIESAPAEAFNNISFSNQDDNFQTQQPPGTTLTQKLWQGHQTQRYGGNSHSFAQSKRGSMQNQQAQQQNLGHFFSSKNSTTSYAQSMTGSKGGRVIKASDGCILKISNCHRSKHTGLMVRKIIRSKSPARINMKQQTIRFQEPSTTSRDHQENNLSP